MLRPHSGTGSAPLAVSTRPLLGLLGPLLGRCRQLRHAGTAAVLGHVVAAGHRTVNLDVDTGVVKNPHERCSAAASIGGCQNSQHKAGLVRDHTGGRL